MLRLVSRPSSTGRLGKVVCSGASHGGRRSIASTSARQADITLTVDGKEVTVPQGSALIQACEAAGAAIPRYVFFICLHYSGSYYLPLQVLLP
ncbi:hypothetical protein EDD22DRAFT_449718 [Suillus occidentalis]|nr:hypothetical protein EDD22DRAFT_449718 [Suillus occidentalis]